MDLRLNLLAANDWISAIAPIVFLVVYLVNALLGGKKKPPQRKPPKPAPPVDPAAAQPAGRKQQSAEIEQFLKRANDRRREKKAGAAPRPPQQPPKAPPRKPARRLVEEPVVAEVIHVPPSGEGVATHVAQHLDKSEFATRAEHMTDDLLEADAAREQKRHKKFDHRLGRLADTSQTAASDPQVVGQAAGISGTRGAESTTSNPAAANLAAMLGNPQTVRHAIILGEILQIPEDRW